ncbi:hypothetical protein [Marinagarivorans cellulosilyticus]|uniref:Uncharacterized protein n=1 Tax=Marinagarivorans cellulosilyticus TaxID=2721545 RepID=A0AAN1WKP3_9GAMM|nr:hypothetical protein [Marinagarivorans cellulosilyticus]BCD99350.1 hypothetical protein MARGE09_P3552 [Marinagarivorans cellulosilyticus]
MLKIKQSLTLIVSLLILINCSEGQAPLTDVPVTSQSPPASFEFEKILNNTEESSTLPTKADLNGDGLVDKMFWGRRNSNVPLSGVTPVNLWPEYAEVTHGSLRAIGVSYGADLGNFLIYDTNDTSVLDADAALSAKIIQHKNIGLIEEAVVSERAKGDVIVIPTEAGIDTYIFWNGLAFELYEPLDYP